MPQATSAAAFEALLSSDALTLDDLRRVAFDGVPDGLRARVWRLLLDYEPLAPAARASELARRRAQYRQFLIEVTTRPSETDTIPSPPAVAQILSVATTLPQPLTVPSASAFSVPPRSQQLGVDSGTQPARLASLLAMSTLEDSCSNGSDGGNERPVGLFGSSDGSRMSLFGGSSRRSAAASLIATASSDAPMRLPSQHLSSLPPLSLPLPAAAALSLPLTVPVVDDPLSAASGKHSKWAEWHRDEELRVEIEKDIQRTLPGVPFFTDAGNLAAMSRILFVYAKLNAGVRYVQGMNELLAPIWLVMATADDPSRDGSMADAEADAFFCFMGLMAEVRDLFIKAHDNSPSGVRGMLARFGAMLARREPAVTAHLSRLRLDAQFFAFRWVTTLLSREFAMPDVLALWDCLFADSARFAFLLHVCTGMVRLQCEALLNSDFGACMKLLQHYPAVSFAALRAAGVAVREEEFAYYAARAAAAAQPPPPLLLRAGTAPTLVQSSVGPLFAAAAAAAFGMDGPLSPSSAALLPARAAAVAAAPAAAPPVRQPTPVPDNFGSGNGAEDDDDVRLFSAGFVAHEADDSDDDGDARTGRRVAARVAAPAPAPVPQASALPVGSPAASAARRMASGFSVTAGEVCSARAAPAPTPPPLEDATSTSSDEAVGSPRVLARPVIVPAKTSAAGVSSLATEVLCDEVPPL